MSTVLAGDLEVHYEEDYFGDPWVPDPPVILVQHGFSGGIATFNRWVPALATRYRVIRRALFAHDGTTSGTSAHGLTLDGLADDLVAFLDALAIERIHFLGTHTGGMSGLPLAARHPDRVRSLGLLDCPIRTAGLQTRLVANLPDDLRARYPTWSEAIRGFGGYAEWYDATRGEPTTAVARWQRYNLSRADPAGLERYVAAMRHFDTEKYFGEVGVPTFVIALSGSTVTTIGDQAAMCAAIADAELVVADEVGRSIVEMAPAEPGFPHRYLSFLGARFPEDNAAA